MIDQKKGFSAGVSDADWAILGEREPKMQSYTQLQQAKGTSPTKTDKNPQHKQIAKQNESESEEESDDYDAEYDDEEDEEYGSEDEEKL